MKWLRFLVLLSMVAAFGCPSRSTPPEAVPTTEDADTAEVDEAAERGLVAPN
jgi:hypothetical protein